VARKNVQAFMKPLLEVYRDHKLICATPIYIIDSKAVRYLSGPQTLTTFKFLIWGEIVHLHCDINAIRVGVKDLSRRM
jgi:hypothetical protein